MGGLFDWRDNWIEAWGCKCENIRNELEGVSTVQAYFKVEQMENPSLYVAEGVAGDEN